MGGGLSGTKPFEASCSHVHALELRQILVYPGHPTPRSRSFAIQN